jgi:soluble lytic murein transglycosylase-like protein
MRQQAGDWRHAAVARRSRPQRAIAIPDSTAMLRHTVFRRPRRAVPDARMRRLASLLLALAAWPQAHAQVMEIGEDGSVRHLGEGWATPGAAQRPAAAAHASVVAAAPPYRAAFEAAAARHGLSVALLQSLAWSESRYDASAVSPAGAIGVMQLMPATARALAVDPWDPQQNIEGGAAYLRQQLDRFDGDLERALAAYNAGPGQVQRHAGVPPFRETRAYVAGNLERLAELSVADGAASTVSLSVPQGDLQ